MACSTGAISAIGPSGIETLPARERAITSVPMQPSQPHAQAVRTYLQDLQRRITQAISTIDGQPFLRDDWEKAPGEPLQGKG